ncbi:MAG: Fic family protein [Candidatus Omnitrophica bacterium]|nr:Fic family protein [Candidatus Omnitrophota bacterium]
MFDPKVELTREYLKLIAEIDEFKGRWEALGRFSPEHLQGLRHVATIESIGSSTRIEGATLSDAEIETLLAHIGATPFSSRDEEEVAGYAEAIDLVFHAFEDLRITENHIRQLHRLLLKHSSKDERHRGDYKKLSNNVVARDPDGNEIAVVFQTATPFKTPDRMEELVRWVNRAIEEESFHPLLIVGIFVVEFLAIHPFQDGNGRLSRILTTLMLLRAGYRYVPYASLERIVEENKDLYYRALRRTQSTLKKEPPDWEPWLGFFLRCLKKQKDQLEKKIHEDKVARNMEDLPVLSSEIIDLLGNHETLSAANLSEILGANRNTLKVRLRDLIQAGFIKRQGKGRATLYRLLRR